MALAVSRFEKVLVGNSSVANSANREPAEYRYRAGNRVIQYGVPARKKLLPKHKKQHRILIGYTVIPIWNSIIAGHSCRSTLQER